MAWPWYHWRLWPATHAQVGRRLPRCMGVRSCRGCSGRMRWRARGGCRRRWGLHGAVSVVHTVVVVCVVVVIKEARHKGN